MTILKQADCIGYIANSRTFKMYQNQHAEFLFVENRFKLKKDPELFSGLYFLHNYLLQNFLL